MNFIFFQSQALKITKNSKGGKENGMQACLHRG